MKTNYNLKKVNSILLVEDDEDDQLFFLEALRKYAVIPTCAVVNNGFEALTALQKQTLPDIIFMDINMPLMNGMECLFHIRHNDQTKNIPVIMLSTSAGQKMKAMELGATAFMQKASSISGITEQLKIYLDADIQPLHN